MSVEIFGKSNPKPVDPLPPQKPLRSRDRIKCEASQKEKQVTFTHCYREDDGGRVADWHFLPEDLWSRIFSEVPIEERLLTLSRVCKTWAAISRQATCYTTVDAEEWCQMSTMYVTLDLVEGPQKLERRGQDGLIRKVVEYGRSHLELLHVRQCTGQALQAIGALGGCPRLRHLQLQDVRGQVDNQLRAAISELPELEHLTVQPLFMETESSSSPTISDATILQLAVSCPKLVSLDFTECRHLRARSIVPLLRARGSSLKSLILDSCLDPQEASAVAWALQKFCSGLRSLNLSHSGLAEEGVMALSSLSQLEDLTLNGCDFPLFLPKVVGSLGRLTHVDVSENLWLIDSDVHALAASCPKLNFLDISHTSVTDASLRSLAKFSRHLEELHCDYNDITDSGLLALASGRPLMKVVSLKSTALTDAALAIASKFRNLKRLTVVGFRSISLPQQHHTIDEVCEFVSSCPNLQAIGLSVVPLVHQNSAGASAEEEEAQPGLVSRDSSVTSEASRSLGIEVDDPRLVPIYTEQPQHDQASLPCIQTLAKLGTKLVDVRLDGMEGDWFRDINEAVATLVSACPNLRMLDLNHFRFMSDAALDAIGQHCPLLEQVGFGWCEGITDEGLTRLVSRCERLKLMECCFCPKVTPALFHQLSSCTRPGMEVLSAHNVVFRVLRDSPVTTNN